MLSICCNFLLKIAIKKTEALTMNQISMKHGQTLKIKNNIRAKRRKDFETWGEKHLLNSTV